MEPIWTRTCQECGNKQRARKPNSDKELTQAYLESKCKKCHSPSLDYGTYPSITKDEDNDDFD